MQMSLDENATGTGPYRHRVALGDGTGSPLAELDAAQQALHLPNAETQSTLSTPPPRRRRCPSNHPPRHTDAERHHRLAQTSAMRCAGRSSQGRMFMEFRLIARAP